MQLIFNSVHFTRQAFVDGVFVLATTWSEQDACKLDLPLAEHASPFWHSLAVSTSYLYKRLGYPRRISMSGYPRTQASDFSRSQTIQAYTTIWLCGSTTNCRW